MKLLLVFAIFYHLAAINFAYVDLGTTTEMSAKSPKSSRNMNFVKVNLSRDETVNEKNKADEMSSTTTLKVVTTTAADLMPTKVFTTTQKAHYLEDHSTETIKDTPSTSEKNLSSSSAPPQAKGSYAGNKTRWFFVGAGVGIVLSVIAIYVYNFYKSRSEPSYQNL